MHSLAQSSGLSLLGIEIQNVEGSAIEVAQKAVADCAGLHPRINALMKGSLHTDELLSACLKSSAGLRTSRRISHIFKFDVPGFEKNDRANISAEEKEALQSIAQDLLARTGKELDAQVEDGTLQEICNDH